MEVKMEVKVDITPTRFLPLYSFTFLPFKAIVLFYFLL